MEQDPTPVIQDIRTFLAQVNDEVAQDENRWRAYREPARHATATLDRLRYLELPDRLEEQRGIVQLFQSYAYHNPDEGAIQDIAEWCRASWLSILRDHPDDVETLLGLGHNWLQKSQRTLAIIHQEEGSSSSYGSGSANGPVEERTESPLYVEVRGDLLPAVDFYTRAVNAAERQEKLTGSILSKAAEAYMSLGNVSPTLVAERHFEQAIRYLRRADAMAGYTLAPHLQEWLHDHGRFVS